MAIPIKNSQQIELMRAAGRVVAEAHALVENHLRAGVTTQELDGLVHDFILSRNATPSFLGYRGFPASTCISVNDEVIHGIPGLKRLKNGDIVSVDIGAQLNGFHGDAARTHCVGRVPEEARRLVDVTKQSFFEGIKFAAPGRHLYEISAAIQDYVEANGYSVVRDFTGHGVGRKLHEEPEIPHYKKPGRGPKLAPGMTLAIEPMVNAGTYEIVILDDDWTVVTRDGELSAHYENTILITDSGCELLTVLEEQ